MADYDWAAIEREWSVGTHASFRALARALPSGNQPSHVSISKRVKADLKAWEASDKSKPRPWSQGLATASSLAAAKLAGVGMPTIDEAEAINAHADKIVGLSLSHRTHLLELRTQAKRIGRLINGRLDWIERCIEKNNGFPAAITTIQELNGLLEDNNRMVQKMIQAERLVFGTIGETKEPELGNPDDDAIGAAQSTNRRVADVIAVLRSVGSAGSGSGGSGVSGASPPG